MTTDARVVALHEHRVRALLLQALGARHDAEVAARARCAVSVDDAERRATALQGWADAVAAEVEGVDLEGLAL